MDTRVKVLIAGYFGFANTGDELILDAMIRDFRAHLPGIDITVISGNPQTTRKVHRVNAVGWEDVSQIADEMETCQLVVIGGGGVFHDYWGFDHSSILTSGHMGLSFYSSIAILTAIKGKPLMLFAVGIGPLQSEEGVSIVRTIANQAVLITVRDEESQKILLSLGIPPEKISVTADPVFSRFSPGNDTQTQPRDHPHAPVVGVVLRNWDVDIAPDIWEKEVAEGLDLFLQPHPSGRVLFIPFQNVKETLLDDFGISKRVQRLMAHSNQTSIISKSLTFAEKAGALSQCDLLLGMRLHALILAIKYGIPAVGISYDPKVTNLMTVSKLDPYTIPITTLNHQVLAGTLESGMRNREQLRTKLNVLSKRYAGKSAKNVQSALKIIKSQADQQKIHPDMVSLLSQSSLELIQRDALNQNRISELTKQVSSLKLDIDQQLLLQKEQKARISLLDDELEKLDRQMSEMNSRNKALLDQMEEQNRTLQHENRKLNDNILALENTQQDLNREKQKLFVENRKITKEKRELTKEILNAKKSSGAMIGELNQKIEEKSIAEKNLSNELNSIKSSRGWKLLWGLWQIRQFLIPHGSTRERTIRAVFLGFRKVKKKPVRSYGRTFRRIINKNGFFISRYAYPFLVYKKRRDKTWKGDISGLKMKWEPGLVSIVLPVYNGEKYLTEAVESILNQTYKNLELILVDDGSTDATGKIIDEYSKRDKRIRVLHQKNQKLPQSLNNGFMFTSGEYLTWTSDDNRMKPNFLEKMVAALEKHPAWDMVYANMDIIGDDGQFLIGSDWYAGYQNPYGSEHIHLPMDTSELNTWPNNFIGGAFLYRSRVHHLLAGYDPAQFTREDYDYWMQVNSLFKLKHMNFRAPVYDYRFHSSSLTHNDESLNITRDRKYLMVLDDFRRDFYLMPLIWIVDEPARNSREEKVYGEISGILSASGQVQLTPSEAEKLNLPHLWIPGIYLEISSDAGLCPTGRIPADHRMVNILLCTSDKPLPDVVNNQWDICLSLGSNKNPPKINSGSHGWWACDNLHALMKAADIKVRSIHLQQIEKESISQPAGAIKVSVIICTYGRNQVLERSLRAIADQTMPISDYEVLVIDNHPQNSQLPSLIDQIRKEKFGEYPDRLRLVHCPITGLSFARNAGISEARSEILLFLDDDSIARLDILDQYWKAFSVHPDAGVIGGHIILKRPEDCKMIWRDGWERYWSQFKTGFREYTQVENWWEFPWGANWCARRIALMQIGGFRGRYGRRGNDFAGGEEIIAASLIQKLGYRIAVLPQAEVIHQVDPSRFSTTHLKRTINAGIQVNYQEQQDLYLPYESNIKTSIKQSMGTFGKLMSALARSTHDEKKAYLLELEFFLSARTKLLLRQTADSLRRIRFFFPFLNT
jgi:polysaccharide pyruvyl transferase CsaB